MNSHRFISDSGLSEKAAKTMNPSTSDNLECIRYSPVPGRPQQMRCRNTPQEEDSESKLKRFQIYLSNTPTLQGLCELSWSGIPVKVNNHLIHYHEWDE